MTALRDTVRATGTMRWNAIALCYATRVQLAITRTNRVASPAMSPECLALLERAVARFPTPHACADALGLTPRRLTAALHNKTTYAFNAVNCLRLADILKVPASRVLRAADHAELAEALERLYRRPTPAEVRLLAKVARLPVNVQRVFLALVQAEAAACAPAAGRRPRATKR